MICPSCGVPNEEGGKFCAGCGANLPTRQGGGISALPTRLVTEETSPKTPAEPPQEMPLGQGLDTVLPEVRKPPANLLKAGPTRMAPPPTPPSPPPAPAHPGHSSLAAPPTRPVWDLAPTPQPLPPSSTPPPTPEPPPEPARPEPDVPEPAVPAPSFWNPASPPAPAPAQPWQPELPPAVPRIPAPADDVVPTSLHQAVADNVRAIAIWFMVFGLLDVAGGAYSLSFSIGAAIQSLVAGLACLATGYLLWRYHPLGRQLGLAMGALSLLFACLGVTKVVGHFGLAQAMLPAVFGLMAILALVAPQASEVCSPDYQDRLQSTWSKSNLHTPFFWIPGLVAGLVFIYSALKH